MSYIYIYIYKHNLGKHTRKQYRAPSQSILKPVHTVMDDLSSVPNDINYGPVLFSSSVPVSLVAEIPFRFSLNVHPGGSDQNCSVSVHTWHYNAPPHGP